MKTKLPERTTDYTSWYSEVIKQAELAEHSPVRGCMIIKPYGFAMWERIKNCLDTEFKRTGHQNVYFPLLIPVSFFSKEATHVEGFAKECAVVTHYRLRNNRATNSIEVDPSALLEEPLIVRPTSETIIWDSFKKWVQSYRDLPLLINQWANIVRWEMRTRPFLRTAEILWQEGHTAHATAEEAEAEAKQMLGVYTSFIRDKMAVPIIVGEKTANERFAGAEKTYTMEAMMQDGKALQMGTSHFLGQNFAKAFDVKFANAKGELDHVWGTSWGVTTRLIGALIMVHSDDKGLVLPPALAPIQGVIVPIYKKGMDKKVLLDYAQEVEKKLLAVGLRIKLDSREDRQPGWKFMAYERQGIPLCIAIGPKDIATQKVEIRRRDLGDKQYVAVEALATYATKELDAMQQDLYNNALTAQKERIHYTDSWEEFQSIMAEKSGFVMAHWDGKTATELAIKEATKATIRCIPLDAPEEEGTCIYSGKPSTRRVLFAQAY